MGGTKCPASSSWWEPFYPCYAVKGRGVILAVMCCVAPCSFAFSSFDSDLVVSGLDFGKTSLVAACFFFLLNSFSFDCRLVSFFWYEWNRGRSPFHLKKQWSVTHLQEGNRETTMLLDVFFIQTYYKQAPVKSRWTSTCQIVRRRCCWMFPYERCCWMFSSYKPTVYQSSRTLARVPQLLRKHEKPSRRLFDLAVASKLRLLHRSVPPPPADLAGVGGVGNPIYGWRFQ
jgi:hypothetical protein